MTRWSYLFGAAFFSTGAALVIYFLSGISLLLAGATTVALGVLVATFIFVRASGVERAALGRSIRVGLGAGAIATVAYDLTRYVVIEVLDFTIWPFDTFTLFGQALMGTEETGHLVFAVGTAYHLANGLGFAIAYTVWLGRRGALAGILFALVLEAVMLAFYPGWLDIRAMNEFVSMSILGHVAYGGVLGYTARRMLTTGEFDPGVVGRATQALWVGLPLRARRLSALLSAALADGNYLLRWPIIAVLVPPLALAFGVAMGLEFGGFDAGRPRLYSESLWLVMGFVSLAALSGHASALFTVGFVAADLFASRLGFEITGGPVQSFAGICVQYLLLGMTTILLPLTTKSLVYSLVPGLPVPERHKIRIAYALFAIVGGGHVYFWSQSYPVLIRPYYTWRGMAPHTPAIEALQTHGFELFLVAAAASVVRLALQSGAARDPVAGARMEQAADSIRTAAPVTSYWSRLPALIRIVIQTGVSVALLSGLYESFIDPILIGGAVALFGVLRLRPAPAPLDLWRALMARIPLLLRMVGGLVATMVVGSTLFFQRVTGNSFGPFLMLTLISLTIFFLLNPGEPGKSPREGEAR